MEIVMTEPVVAEAPVEVKEQTILGSEETKTDNTLLATEEVEESSTEEKAVEEKPAEEKPEETKESQVPEKYELVIPEGMEIDNGLVEKFTPLFKKHNFKNEDVQEFADLFAPYAKEKTEAAQKEALDFHDKQKEDWGKETKAFLGAKTKESLAASAKFINTYAENEQEAQAIRDMLNISGLGNYLPFVKMIVKAGNRLKQDSFVEPNKHNSFSDAERNPEKYLYKTMSS